MLSVRDVTKWLGARRVLHRFSLDIARGERIVLLGENGCGKSTLLQLVTGVLDEFEGTISAPGALGYAPEKPDLPEHLLAGEWLDLVASLKRVPAPLFERDELAVSGLLGRKIGALSLGQRQRISLAGAFIGDPALLVLDEPTNALDADAREALIAHVLGSTALVATHDRELAQRIATRVVHMTS